MEADELEAQPFRLLKEIELDWKGKEELFVRLLSLKNQALVAGLMGGSVPPGIKGFGTFEIENMDWWLDWIEELYTPDMNTKYVYPNVFMSREDTEKLSNLQADITKLINAKKSDWIMNGFTDADWDQYLKDLDAYKLNDMLAIFQKYLDAYYADESGNAASDTGTDTVAGADAGTSADA